MITIEDSQLGLCDVFGNTQTTKPARKATDGFGNTIIFCQSTALENIDAFEKDFASMSDEDLKDCGFKVSATEIKKQCDIMRNIVNNLDDNTITKIMECLPRYANGSIRSTIIPVYLTGITQYEGYDSGCYISSVELSVKPAIDYSARNSNNIAEFLFAPDKKVKNAFIFDFTNKRVYDKKDIPVINPDGTYNQLTYKRNSYIPIDELIPGYIYKDAKDRKFLYLGVIEVKRSGGSVDLTQPNPSNSNVSWRGWQPGTTKEPYVFLALNDKRERELKASATFGEWLEKDILKITSKRSSCDSLTPVSFYEFEHLKIAKSFKVVEEVEQLFDWNALQCNIDVTACKDADLAALANTRYTSVTTQIRTRFRICDERAVWQYSVVEFSTNGSQYDQTTLLETLDKNEASKFIKDYLKANPTAEKAQGYQLRGKKKNIWMYENIVAVAPHKA